MKRIAFEVSNGKVYDFGLFKPSDNGGYIKVRDDLYEDFLLVRRDYEFIVNDLISKSKIELESQGRSGEVESKHSFIPHYFIEIVSYIISILVSFHFCLSLFNRTDFFGGILLGGGLVIFTLLILTFLTNYLLHFLYRCIYSD